MGRMIKRARARLNRSEAQRGQGMTEYAVLIGVIVLVALVVFLFRDQLAGLFNSATSSITSLNTQMH